MSTLASALGEIVGTEHVLTDPDVTASYATDWTGRFRGDALLVVRPADTQQVAAVVARCADAGAAVVPQGGNTGLVGGGVPRRTADGRAVDAPARPRGRRSTPGRCR